MPQLTYLAAIGAAQQEAMAEDVRVVLMGEDVRSNLYGTAPNFVELFGAARVINTPISEASFAGMGVGAAMTGLRPIVDLTYATFMYLAFDQLIKPGGEEPLHVRGAGEHPGRVPGQHVLRVVDRGPSLGPALPDADERAGPEDRAARQPV